MAKLFKNYAKYYNLAISNMQKIFFWNQKSNSLWWTVSKKNFPKFLRNVTPICFGLLKAIKKAIKCWYSICFYRETKLFALKINPLNSESRNQAKNIPVAVLSSQSKLEANLSRGFYVMIGKNKQTESWTKVIRMNL